MDKEVKEYLEHFERKIEDIDQTELKLLIEGAVRNMSLGGEERDRCFFNLGAAIAAEMLGGILGMPTSLVQAAVKGVVESNFEKYYAVLKALSQKGAQ